MVAWETCRERFAFDGGRLDVYVFDTDERDWQRFLDFVRAEPTTHRFTVDGAEAPLPERVREIFAARHHDATVCLGIDPAGLGWNCHFFGVQELELDLDPRVVTTEAAFDRALAFLRALGTRLGKPLVLTPEHLPAVPLLRFDPATQRFTPGPALTPGRPATPAAGTSGGDVNTLRVRTRLAPERINGEAQLHPELLVDGQPLVDFGRYGLHLRELLESTRRDGEFFIVTCVCGDAGCAGIWRGIAVRWEGGCVRWVVAEPGPPRTLTFAGPAYRRAADAGVRELGRLTRRHGGRPVPHTNDDLLDPGLSRMTEEPITAEIEGRRPGQVVARIEPSALDPAAGRPVLEAGADAFVERAGFRPIGRAWVELPAAAAANLASLLWKELAHHTEVMPRTEADRLAGAFLGQLPPPRRCLTSFPAVAGYHAGDAGGARRALDPRHPGALRRRRRRRRRGAIGLVCVADFPVRDFFTGRRTERGWEGPVDAGRREDPAP